MPFKDKEKKREYQNKWCRDRKYGTISRNRSKLRNIEFVRKYKENKPCDDCGKYFHFFVMDFDHREGETKIENVAQLAHKGYALDKLIAEIEKCDLVCANCHRLRTFRRLHWKGKPKVGDGTPLLRERGESP
jgi:hypothetical protein